MGDVNGILKEGFKYRGVHVVDEYLFMMPVFSTSVGVLNVRTRVLNVVELKGLDRGFQFFGSVLVEGNEEDLIEMYFCPSGSDCVGVLRLERDKSKSISN